MSEKLMLFWGWIAILCHISCSPLKKPSIDGEIQHTIQNITIKFSYFNEQEQQKGKLNWKLGETYSRFVFLSPLNEAYLELYLNGEQVIMVKRRNRIYWEGEFRNLLQRLWNLDFRFNDMQALILTGNVPDQIKQKADLHIKVEKGKTENRVQRVEIKNNGDRLILKVLKNETRIGQVFFNPHITSFQKVEIDEFFKRD